MNGWLVGILAGAIVVAIVVAVLLVMITGARRTAEKAEAIVAGLHDVRDRTEGLWLLGETVRTAERIVEAAADARRSLTPGGRA